MKTRIRGRNAAGWYNRGRDERQRDGSRLLIRGTSSDGEAFEEEVLSEDISDTGVSFHLVTPIWMDSHLTIVIKDCNLFEAEHSAQAKVVRLRSDPSGGQFVAARFD